MLLRINQMLKMVNILWIFFGVVLRDVINYRLMIAFALLL